jgi:hypothetical protein
MATPTKPPRLPLYRINAAEFYRPAFWGTMFKRLADAGSPPASQVYPHLPSKMQQPPPPKRKGKE